jgi:hypothetical protein
LAVSAATRPLYVEDDYDFSHGVGPLRVHARVDTAVQEDSNVNLRSDNKISDEIFVLRPDLGLRLVSGTERFDAGLRYRMDIERFSEYTHFNNQNRFLDADIHLRDERFALSLSDRFENTNDRTSVSFTDLVKRKDNTLSGEARIFFEPAIFAVQGTQFRRDYEDQYDALRYSQTSVRPMAWLRVSERWQLLGDATVSGFDYPGEPQRSGSGGQQLAGIVFNARGGLRAQWRGGFQQRRFDGVMFSDVDRFLTDVEVNFQPRGHTAVFFRGESNVEEAIVDANNGWYRNVLATAGLEQRLTNLTKVNASFYVSRQRYPDLSSELQLRDRRRDTVWYGQTSVSYQVRARVQLYADFSYTKRRSNVVLREYVQKLASVGIKVEL